MTASTQAARSVSNSPASHDAVGYDPDFVHRRRGGLAVHRNTDEVLARAASGPTVAVAGVGRRWRGWLGSSVCLVRGSRV